MPPVRRTKIIATVGPASHSEATLEQLVAAGVDVFRLNFSHGSHEQHAEAVHHVRRIAERDGRAVAILQDLQGPRLRTGTLLDDGPVFLESGNQLILTADELPDGTSERVSVNHANLPADVSPGDRLFLADGVLELEVTSTGGADVYTTVVQGGELGERKGINAPNVNLSVASPTQKDLDDLAFGVSLGVDYVALSFVRQAAGILAIREALRALGASHVPIIAKLERAEAITHLDAILAVSDSVMVARGDLGVDLGTERVPMLQKMIVHRANRRRVPVIIATQMLESMVQSRHPTRAEASDVANALLDGADAVMLSAETTIGRYPVDAVQTMDRIVREVEGDEEYTAAQRSVTPDRGQHDHRIARAIAELARELDAAAIVVYSADGHTPQLVSMERPRAPIYAFTDSRAVYRKLALYHAVVPQRGRFVENTDELIGDMLTDLATRGLVSAGDEIIVARIGHPEQPEMQSYITVRHVPSTMPAVTLGPANSVREL